MPHWANGDRVISDVLAAEQPARALRYYADPPSTAQLGAGEILEGPLPFYNLEDAWQVTAAAPPIAWPLSSNPHGTVQSANVEGNVTVVWDDGTINTVLEETLTAE